MKIILSFIGSLLVVVGMNFSQASETMKGAQKDYETFKQELSSKMDSLDKEIERLKAKTKEKGVTLKGETIEELEKYRTELKAQILEMETKSKSKWKTMKKSLSESFESLHAKIQRALKD